MYKLAEEHLAFAPAAERTIDVLDSRTTVARTLDLARRRPELELRQRQGSGRRACWTHARTFLRIDSEKVQDGIVIESD